jgi:hypothetical protein
MLWKKDGMEAVRSQLLVGYHNVLISYKTGDVGKECDSNKKFLIVVKRWKGSEVDMILFAPVGI